LGTQTQKSKKHLNDWRISKKNKKNKNFLAQSEQRIYILLIFAPTNNKQQTINNNKKQQNHETDL